MRFRHKEIALYSFFLFFFPEGFSQSFSLLKLERNANINFELGKYKIASGQYQKLLSDSSYKEHLLCKYRLGICYFYSESDKSKAIPLFKEVVSAYKELKEQEDMIGDVVFYYLAKSYHLFNEFEKAIVYYKKFQLVFAEELLNDKGKAKGNNNEKEYTDVPYPQSFGRKKSENRAIRYVFKEVIELVNDEIQRCENGIVLKANPVNVKIENMGETVNSVYPEYAPVIRGDGAMVYTARRKGTTGNRKDTDGKYFEDIYISFLEQGLTSGDFQTSYTQDINARINSHNHDAAIQFSADGSKLFFCRQGRLWVSALTPKGTWGKAKNIPTLFSETFEPSMALSSDEQTFYLVSDQPGGMGGLDIYFSRRNMQVGWGPLRNMGPIINTRFDEDAPYVKRDDKTLCFASKGHSSMGGYDIFKTTFEVTEENPKGVWKTPQNLGYPINSGADDIYICIMKDERYGYYSSNNPHQGFGDMDIYRLIFPDDGETNGSKK